MRQFLFAKEFTDCPGGRYMADGRHSGEEFRDNVLIPLLNKSSEQIEIVLDGAWGYPASFLEEAFGGLARKRGVKFCKDNLSIVCHHYPEVVEEIWDFISDVERREKL